MCTMDVGTFKNKFNKIENEIINYFNSFMCRKREERLGEGKGDKEKVELETIIEKDQKNCMIKC